MNKVQFLPMGLKMPSNKLLLRVSFPCELPLHLARIFPIFSFHIFLYVFLFYRKFCLLSQFCKNLANFVQILTSVLLTLCGVLLMGNVFFFFGSDTWIMMLLPFTAAAVGDDKAQPLPSNANRKHHFCRAIVSPIYFF